MPNIGMMLVHVLSDLVRVVLRRRRRGYALGIVAVAALAVVRVVVAIAVDAEVRGWFGIGRPTCNAAQISTASAHEGICANDQGLFGSGGTVYNVVDAGHVLEMPGYSAQLLDTRITPTNVTNPQVNPTAYPDGHGMLVSCLITIANQSGTPLSFDHGGTRVELLIDNLAGSGELEYHDLPDADGEPGQSIADTDVIAPHGIAMGWVSFVAPSWAQLALNRRASDLEFYRAGDTSHSYVGQIRMWKWASASGRLAVGLGSAGAPAFSAQP